MTTTPAGGIDRGAVASGHARVLVTGDQPETRAAIRLALGDSHEIEFAKTPGQALEMIAAGGFEVAICNIEDIDGAGLRLATEIARDHPDTAAVVLATGEDDREAARSAFASGVYAYLVEPFWPGQLLITIMGALRRRELEIAARRDREDLAARVQAIIDMVPIAIFAKAPTVATSSPTRRPTSWRASVPVDCSARLTRRFCIPPSGRSERRAIAA